MSLNKFLPDHESNYEVFTSYSDTPVYFDKKDDAIHFARLNTGTVTNLNTFEVIATFVEQYD